MFSKPITTLSLLLLCIVNSFSQLNTSRKKLSIKRVQNAPKIDGILNDDAWNNVEVAKNFVMMRPNNGQAEPETHKTEVKFVYDDSAIYISAIMYDNNPSSIPMEFTNRDNFGNTDFFLITINPNDDGQNPFQFIVQSTGNQADAKVSNGDEDFNWSAVWESDVKLTDKGWIAEIKIPYRALRFSNQPIQNWGINIHRKIESLNAQFTWNHIDNTKGRWTQYDGLLEGLKNIQPPTRLNLYPYASTSIKTVNNKTNFDWSVGMDIKYGVTENFTLDATLIPDFGQTGFDDVTLNLGPFEQQFSEQRQFFTEGTELFTKGRLFYSRRIGGSPIDQFSNERKDDKVFLNGIKTNDKLIDAPEKVNMLNAIKLSGRTKKGLGIGFFNAITETTKATVERTEKRISGIDTTIVKSNYNTVTNPFSNYNILVIDQQFNKNSAITLINTNVTRDGRFRDANVTGLLYHIEDKGSNYNIDGSVKMSSISDDIDHPNTGYAFDTSIGKQSGKWRGEIGYNFKNKDYNPNDMGILFSNNEQSIYGFIGYRSLKPKGMFNEYSISWRNNINFLHSSDTYTGTNSSLSLFAKTKKRFAFGGNINFRTKNKDFFEAREGSTSGVFFKRPQRLNINHWGSTDYRKRFAVDYNWYHTFFKNNLKELYGFRISPRYRFNNQFSLIYGFNFRKTNNDQGYVRKISSNDIIDDISLTPFKDDIIFGQRDRSSYNNSISGKYSFDIKSSLALTFRHNWSKVPYQNDFFKLVENGELTKSNYKGDHNKNFNSWNLDLNYQWQFAPGSQLIAFYRNSISPNDDFAPADISFSDNLNRLLEEKMSHTFSLRLVYFIDYKNIKEIL